ncbi:MFS general substrate transporter [Rhizodiscina lignyota]|uniref:MFS general substrate transporter n=1 Tax=Rhizodiscina lignyota TaxID=1504668 RepID=A0A9P4MEE1_9PEZI|nr:MFS general substrate transporter [Rhizodiscina lignyota]
MNRNEEKHLCSSENQVPSPPLTAAPSKEASEEQISSNVPPPYSAFPRSRRLFILIIVTIAGFFSPLCGAVYLPSLVLYTKIFRTTTSVINATVSVYMVVFAIAPLFGAASADYGGRKTVYLVTLAIFILSNILLATIPPNIGALFTLRVFQALGSSMVTSVGAGTVADITEPARRASALAIFLLGPQLGPILGPFIGGQFAMFSRWRWAFGFLAITCTPVYILILFYLPETLRCLVGNGEVLASRGWFVQPQLRQVALVDDSQFPNPPRPTLKTYFKHLSYLPQLIVAFNGALQFAGLYCMYITFPRVWELEYGFSTAEVGYAYLSPGIALFIASLVIGRVSDVLYRRSIRHHDGRKPAPERRLMMQYFGFAVGAAGKLMYGWFSKYHIHPAGGLVGSALAAVGTGIIMITSTSFQTEYFPGQAASLVAVAGMMRNVGAAISAAIIDPLLDGMGLGWCFTGLAILDMVSIIGIFWIMKDVIKREAASSD